MLEKAFEMMDTLVNKVVLQIIVFFQRCQIFEKNSKSVLR